MKRLFLTLLRCLCLLLLLCVTVLYLDGAPNRTPSDLLDEAVTKLPSLLLQRGVLGIAGVILLLTFLRALGCVWNGIFCIASFALLAEVGLYHIGLSALPESLRQMASCLGLGELSSSYPVLHSGIPLLWLVSGLCSTHAIRIALTSLCCYLLWLLCAAGLSGLAQMWETMQDPPFPDLLALLKEVRWWTAALPGAFFFFYAFFMSLFEALTAAMTGTQTAPPSEEEPQPAPR